MYLPVDLEVQLERIRRREQAYHNDFFPMPGHAVRSWRAQFQVPTAEELAGADDPQPPPPWPSWATWATDRWPTLNSHMV